MTDQQQPTTRPRRPRIYVLGPYSGATASIVDANIERAAQAVAMLIRAGWAPLSPHMNTARFERTNPDIPYSAYIDADLAWAEVAWAAFALRGWRHSAGSVIEVHYFGARGIPIVEHGSDGWETRLEELWGKLQA